MTEICGWQKEDSATRPPLRGGQRAQACVVGLGGSGLSCIEELRRQGQTVIGIDAKTVGASAAGRNGGLLLAGAAGFYHQVVADHGSERARAFYQETLDEIRRMQACNPDIIKVTGSLRIAANNEEREDCQKQREAMETDGLPVAWYDGNQGEGLVFPEDAVMNPWLRVRRKAKEVEAMRARLFEQSRAVLIGEGIVETEDGFIECEQVIVAVDGRLEKLVPELAGRVRTARLQMLMSKPADMQITQPAYYRYGMEYWQQTEDGRIFLGGGRDQGGDEEWSQDEKSTEAVQVYLRQLGQERFGLREEDVEAQWGACVAFTPSGYPVIEEVKPGVWVIGGYSGTGNLVGALAGRAVAQKIEGQTELWDKLLRDQAPTRTGRQWSRV